MEKNNKMTLQALIYYARELNPVMDESKEDFGLDCIDRMHDETAGNDVSADYRKPFIPYNQTLNTQTINAGAA